MGWESFTAASDPIESGRGEEFEMPSKPQAPRIADGSHYLVQAHNLASWIEDQGEETLWSVDGDPLLMSRLSFPCPPEEIATELRKVDRPLLVADPNEVGRGEEIIPQEFARLSHLLETEELGLPVLYMSWQGEHNDWLLIEDQPSDDSSEDER